MEKIEEQLQKVAKRKRIGLWRTHPSLFFVSLYIMAEAIASFFIFRLQEVNIASYSNLFIYIPQWLYSSIFLLGGAILLFALATRLHVWLRVGALILLVPNIMMVTNFIVLAIDNEQTGLIIACFKWGLDCLMLLLMTREPFVNPLSAR